MRWSSTLPIFRSLAVAVLASACVDASPTGSTRLESTGAIRYEVVAGDGQAAPAGAELPEPLVVRVLDPLGQPVEGQIVNWVVTAGGGSVFAGRSLTDASGTAQEWWTLGTEPGTNALEARAVDSSTGEALVFGRFEATGIDQADDGLLEPEPEAAPPTSISLSAMAYKEKGRQKVDLRWSGAGTATVDVFRDGALLLSTGNDGAHLDSIDARGGGSYRYRVCEAEGGACSGEVVASF